MLRKFYALLPARILRKRNNSNNNVEEVYVDYDYLEQIDKARVDLRRIIEANDCAALMLRLSWSDAATYDARTGDGGPNGSIRFLEEYSHPCNGGVKVAIDLLEPVKRKYPRITYADLYQLAGIVAVRVAGGPQIIFIPGRTDSTDHRPFEWSRFPSPTGDAGHLRNVFNRMGFTDREIVVLSGGHTLGEAHREHSDFEGAWTRNPWRFDNSYFKELLEPNRRLLRLPTDNALIQDRDFRGFVQYYAQDINPFFEHYATAHRKFSELGYVEFMQEYVTETHLMCLTVALIFLGTALACINKRK